MSEPTRTGSRRGAARRRLGITLGLDSLAVLELRARWDGLRPRRLLRCPIAPAADGAWTGLGTALAEAAHELDSAGAVVDIALLPPLAQTKVLSLPPLRPRALHQLVLHNARRYFVLRDDGGVIAAERRWRRLRRGAPAPTLVACAPRWLIEAVAAATAQAGLRLSSIAPAPVALLAAAVAQSPAVRRGVGSVVIATPEWSELVFLDRGRPVLFQPLPADVGEEDAESAAAAVVEACRRAKEAGVLVTNMIVVGEAGVAQAVAERAAGTGVLPPLLSVPVLAATPPDALAALGAAAHRDELPLLQPDSVLRATRRRDITRAAAMAALSLALLAVAGSLRLWDLRQELAAVRAQREQLAPLVQEIRTARQTMTAVRGALEELDRIERSAPRRTAQLAALAEALPATAYLETLAIDGSRLRVSGYAGSASALVPTLAGAPSLHDVALAAPVRRDEVRQRESFALVATLDTVTTTTNAGGGSR